jgi:hypothetical protein
MLRRINGRAGVTRFVQMEAITPFITSAGLSSAANVDIFHHQHGIIETVCADLIDSTRGPSALRELRRQLRRRVEG